MQPDLCHGLPGAPSPLPWRSLPLPPRRSARSMSPWRPGPRRSSFFSTKVQTFTAEFEQELRSSDQRVLETAAGTLSLKRPNRFPVELRGADRAACHRRRGAALDVRRRSRASYRGRRLKPGDAASPAMLLSGEQNVRDSFRHRRRLRARRAGLGQAQPEARRRRLSAPC